MDKEDIIPWDWQRIFIGEVPVGFLVEVIIRVGFVYLLLLISMRILGKKMASQFTRNEMAAMVSLAAAIGVPILTPDRGVLPAVVICITIVSLSRVLQYYSIRDQKIEALALGATEKLIDDGVMNIKTMRSTGLSKERVFAQLRASQILHLGEVSRLYFEANGKFTLIKSHNPKPGLVVIPDTDKEFVSHLSKTLTLACDVCGYLNDSGDKNMICPSCTHSAWRTAVASAEELPEDVAVSQH